MTKKINIIFFFILLPLTGCSFDDKTGIWTGSDIEKRQLSELEKKQKEIIDIEKIYSSENIYSKEIVLNQKIILSKPVKSLSWNMSNLNHQNSTGNNYLESIDNIFLKKKIGKNKFFLSRLISPPLAHKGNLILSDDNGTIFKINQNGKVLWKKKYL